MSNLLLNLEVTGVARGGGVEIFLTSRRGGQKFFIPAKGWVGKKIRELFRKFHDPPTPYLMNTPLEGCVFLGLSIFRKMTFGFCMIFQMRTLAVMTVVAAGTFKDLGPFCVRVFKL